MLKKLALISAVSVFAMSTALAQSPTAPAPTSPPAASTETKSGGDFIAAQKPEQWLGTKLKGTNVTGTDNQKVGSVSDILFEKDGSKILAYVISVGGFLGMGSKEVALAPTAFQVVPGDPNSATNRSPTLKISMTKEQLKDAPNFEPYKEPNRATTGTGGGMPRPGGMGGGMSK